MKERIYRGWKTGDVGYFNGQAGNVKIDKQFNTKYPIYWEDIDNSKNYETFTLDSKYCFYRKHPTLSFLPNEQSMPFDEVDVLDNNDQPCFTDHTNALSKLMRKSSNPEQFIENIHQTMLNHLYEFYIDQLTELDEKHKEQRNELEKKRLILRGRIG